MDLKKGAKRGKLAPEGEKMEVELKYNCPNGAVFEEILTYAAQVQQGPAREIRMQTDYYDTPERTLRERFWTLRLRRENDERVVCCKTRGSRSGALSSHNEWECEAEDFRSGVKQLVAQGAPEELLAIADRAERFCGAAFLRISADLVLESGTVAELSCDRGKLLGAKSEQSLCEVELELKAGPVEPMLAYGAALAARFGLKEESRSKLARAMELE